MNVTEFRRGDVTIPAGDPLVEPSGKIELAPHEIPVGAADPAFAAGIRSCPEPGERL